ncbi:MAG: hypothetical protein LQ352_005211 [Teloschistes flavicans]|nr:MAG: hypothetical protein LQ352_005211 [Teloschistes flavicans]
MDSVPGFDFDCFNVVSAVTGDDMSNFRVENLTLPEDPHAESFFVRRAKIPSLREIRAINSISTSSRSSNTNEETGEPANETNSTQQVLAQLKSFSFTIFTTQAEIAGISSAVAEYLAWLKKVPGLPKAPIDTTAVLETLEARARELQEMAEEKHWFAWKKMLENLDSSTEGGHIQLLKDSEAEMRRRTIEVEQDFHATYDVAKAMQEQENLQAQE